MLKQATVEQVQNELKQQYKSNEVIIIAKLMWPKRFE